MHVPDRITFLISYIFCDKEVENMPNNEVQTVLIHLKMAMSICEAAEYSSIGINKSDALLWQPIVTLCYLSERKS